jgi:hypothetical protein
MTWVAIGSLVDTLNDQDEIDIRPVETLCSGDRVPTITGEIGVVVCTILMGSRHDTGVFCTYGALRAHPDQYVYVRQDGIATRIGTLGNATMQRAKGYMGIVMAQQHAVVAIDGVYCSVVSDYNSALQPMR